MQSQKTGRRDVKHCLLGKTMAAAVMESQALHMSALALHKNGPIPSETLRQKGLKGTYPALLNSLLLVDPWKEKTIAFG